MNVTCHHIVIENTIYHKLRISFYNIDLLSNAIMVADAIGV